MIYTCTLFTKHNVCFFFSFKSILSVFSYLTFCARTGFSLTNNTPVLLKLYVTVYAFAVSTWKTHGTGRSILFAWVNRKLDLCSE